MNDHEMEKSLISAYCDGELSAADMVRAEKVLESSAEARAELLSYRKLSSLLQSSVVAQGQFDLAPDVMRAVHQHQTTSQSKTTAVVLDNRRTNGGNSPVSFKQFWSVAAASVACLAVMVWWGWNGRPGQQQLADHEVESANPKVIEQKIVEQNTTTNPVAPVKASETAIAQAADGQSGSGDLSHQPPVKRPLEASQLPVELIADLKNSNVGQLNKFIRQNQDGVTVFHLMVMDIKPGMESLELILSAQEISGVNGRPVNDRADVVAVYIEAKQEKMEALVQKIKDDHQKFLALGVQQEAMPADRVATLVAKATSDESRAIPLNAGELENVGVAPLQANQIEVARNSAGQRAFKAPPKTLANKAASKTGNDVSPMLKLLILVEKSSPAAILNQPSVEQN